MSLAGLAQDLGFTAVALEYDDFNNASRWEAFEHAMVTFGIKPGAWYTNPHNLTTVPAGAQFLAAEVEDASDYDGALSWIGRVHVPMALVTTYVGLLVKNEDGTTDKDATKARCKPLVDAGFFCQYEAYFYSQPDNTDASFCGFPGEKTAPVLGVGFNGRRLDEQKALQVPGYGIYLAEYLRP